MPVYTLLHTSFPMHTHWPETIHFKQYLSFQTKKIQDCKHVYYIIGNYIDYAKTPAIKRKHTNKGMPKLK